jgi:hypothetical protein
MAAKPLFRDFLGLNVHTVLFKPELYRPVARLLRDYHGFDWDVGDDTAYQTTFPLSRNKVDWERLYGDWVKTGYEINVSLMFGQTQPNAWKDLPRDAFRYGEAFARFFGPSGARKLVTSIEIGNEPGHYPDEVYRSLFENMAKGFRKGDPRLKVVTCATFARKSDKYHKNIECVRGLEPLYDAINVHSYAQVEGWPTWKRSYPEDPAIPYLKDIEELIAWRNRNAPGKPVWLTEFGWDATTKPQEKEGTFKQWVGVTDTQQARYIVRSFLVFSGMDLGRAYLYWFNDDDKPSVHASAGLTRKYQPKPSFHAMAHLFQTLGPYRYVRVVQAKPGDLYVYDYQHGSDPKQRIWAVWSPTGTDRTATVTLTGLPGKVEKAEQMPLAPGPAETVRFDTVRGGIRLDVTESPAYLFLRLA